jgi:O-methyltransferase involved in polyketide biosynthesis
MAAARALEQQLPDRLVDDLFSAIFAGKEAMRNTRTGHPGKPCCMQCTKVLCFALRRKVAVCTRFFDDFVRDAV